MTGAGAELVACVGDNCVDVSPAQAAEVGVTSATDGNGAAGAPAGPAELPGGNAFNVAVALARSGTRAAYLGAIGGDPAANLILDAGRLSGVDMSRVVQLPGLTGRTVVTRDERGERRFVREDYGAAAQYRLDPETVGWLAGARWLHFARQRDLADHVAGLRVDDTRISVDLGYGDGVDELEALAPHVDVVFLSASAAPDLTEGELVTRALRAGAPLVVVTLGAAGSLAASGDRRWTADAVPVEQVIDSLGAGDAYIAAFIAARTDGAQVDEAMRAGARAGAAACTQWGLTGPVQQLS